MPFIDDITCTIYDMSSTVYDITFPICVTSHYACISDITHFMCMIYPLYMASHIVLWQHNHCETSQPLYLTSHQLYLCHQTEWINFIKCSVCMTSQPLCVWHHMHYMWHHIHSLWHHTTLHKTSGPLYLTSFPLYLCHHTHPFDDITGTICNTSHPVYLWHHIHYIYEILSIKYDITKLCVDDPTVGLCTTSFALQMTTHTLYHTKTQYLWCHFPFRQDNTAPVSDITPTFCVTSYELYITSQPILCHTTVLITTQPLYMKEYPVWGNIYT